MPRILSMVAGGALLLGAMVAPAAAQVEGKIERVGLFAGTEPLVRSGEWSFVEVSLRWRGDKPFDGELRVDQFDRDGDVVAFVLEVALPPDNEWHRRQVLFVPHDIARNNAVRVRLFDRNGRLVRMVTVAGNETGDLVSDPIDELPADQFLIVDLTVPQRLPHILLLETAKAVQDRRMNARKVRTMTPRELPEQGQGLEAVDAIVWDNADPSGLSEQQVAALIEWVNQGGRLLITAGTNSQALAHSALASALPVKIKAADQVREAQEFTQIVRRSDYEVVLDRDYNKHPITRCRFDVLSGALPIPAECANPQIAWRKLSGRGEITFVGASLKELLPEPADSTDKGVDGRAPEVQSLVKDWFARACEEVIGRNFLALGEVREETVGGVLSFERQDLFRDLRRSVAFESVSAGFLVFAVLFAVGYTVVAAFGSYWYLKRRSWTHWCWLAFAAVSVAGSIIGTVMVWGLRGVRTQVWQTTVVDAPQGARLARASCLFGVKTPDHTRLRLRLPRSAGEPDLELEPSTLRSMPEVSSLEATESRFVAPEKYESLLAGRRLENVPVRATLKEFQGTWHGSIDGELDARLVELRTDNEQVRYEYGKGSYIRNELGVTLRDCYLFETLDEAAGSASEVRCYYVGDLAKTGPGAALIDEQIRDRLFFEKKPGARPGDEPTRIKSYPRLDAYFKDWRDRAFGVAWSGQPWRADQSAARTTKSLGEQEYYAALLLSVFDLFEADPQAPQALHRSHGRRLDCTRMLTNRTAVLIGWSNDPPPVFLEIDAEPYRPSKMLTVYRFVVPVERVKRH